MRVCWNWQTGTFEVRVLYDIRVQVPSPAPNKKTVHWAVFYFIRKFLRGGFRLMNDIANITTDKR